MPGLRLSMKGRPGLSVRREFDGHDASPFALLPLKDLAGSLGTGSGPVIDPGQKGCKGAVQDQRLPAGFMD